MTECYFPELFSKTGSKYYVLEKLVSPSFSWFQERKLSSAASNPLPAARSLLLERVPLYMVDMILKFEPYRGPPINIASIEKESLAILNKY